jgi:putative transposase
VFGYALGMPRVARAAPGGLVYHALNRAVARLPLFEKPEDYEAFERVLEEAQQRHPTRILAYCVMPNHWHFVLWPRGDGELTAFLRWLTHTHTMRWHAHHHTGGTGHLYQGRFKSFPVQTDEHFYAVVRYVERNAVRANLVPRAEAWRYSSLWRQRRGQPEQRTILSDWPLPVPRDWLRRVNRPETEAELEALRRAVRRGSPYGGPRWVKNTALRLGLEFTVRPRGRPRKET